VAVIGSSSGSGKSTFSRALAAKLGVPYHELDALHHGPNWTEATPAELRAKVEPLVAGEAWVLDGGYMGKLGLLVVEAADTVVWIDLPVRVWLPRLLRRTVRRIRTHEELWNGNQESIRGAFLGWNALLPWTLRAHVSRRREYPARLAHLPVVRLRTQAEVDGFLAAVDE
jgi:adenylate kinase family enzyme